MTAKKNILYIFSVFVGISLFFGSCRRASDPPSVSLKQDETELIADVAKAVSYSGFRRGQHPDRGDGAVNPGDEEILEDLHLLKQTDFRLVRLYDSGENSRSVLRMIKENDLDIKVMLGIWLDAEVSNHEGCPWLTEPIPESVLAENKRKNKREIQRAIQLADAYDQVVVAVNVGNEALVSWNDHMVETDTVISYVKQVKQSIAQPVTVAENYVWWAEQGAELAEQVNFLAVHTYPVWEGKDIDQGLSYTIENLSRVKNALPEQSIVIAEAGWASEASEFGERASEKKQLQYYRQLMGWASEMNITTFWFEAFDEPWKGDPNNPLGAEKHWGLFTVDREPKLVMRTLYPDLFQTE
ncbi:MAG: glycosyl hydrolase family 17 protein [candidate division KSB1 bacterium]|nr:glycosyl hydrolase family 17 protein [candidate division KSB1 bacterium]